MGLQQIWTLSRAEVEIEDQGDILVNYPAKKTRQSSRSFVQDNGMEIEQTDQVVENRSWK